MVSVKNENRSCLYLTLTYLRVRQNHGEILNEFKPFVPNAPFLYPLRFSDVFGVQRKGALGANGLMG